MGYLTPKRRGIAWLFMDTYIPSYVMSAAAILVSLYVLLKN